MNFILLRKGVHYIGTHGSNIWYLDIKILFLFIYILKARRAFSGSPLPNYFFKRSVYIMATRSEVITVKVTPEVKEAILKLAADNYTTVSGFMNELLEKLV